MIKKLFFSLLTIYSSLSFSQIAGKIGMMTPYGSNGYFYSRSPSLEISYLSEYLPNFRLNASAGISLLLPRRQSHIFFKEVGGVLVPFEGKMKAQPQLMLSIGTDYLLLQEEEDGFEAYAGFSILGIFGNVSKKSIEVNVPFSESQGQILAGNTVRVGCQYNPEGAFSYILEGSLHFQWVKKPLGAYGGFVSLGLRYDIKKGKR